MAKKGKKTLADLTSKEHQFIEEYMVDLNAVQAGKRAGYKGHSSGRLMKDPVIRSEIARHIKLRTKANEITVDRVLQELKALAFTNMIDFVKVSKNGTPSFDLTEMTPEQAAAIKEFTINGDGDLVISPLSAEDVPSEVMASVRVG